ncbi:MAG: hypothetical protein HAW67_05180 [Endozoicomonadaceae bacterium]|nr:hypothetical protein [Endozoicomonadaceae bacterium]
MENIEKQKIAIVDNYINDDFGKQVIESLGTDSKKRYMAGWNPNTKTPQMSEDLQDAMVFEKEEDMLEMMENLARSEFMSIIMAKIKVEVIDN